MHRGESTSGQMRRVDPDAISTMSSKSARITFNALRLENVDHFRSIAAAKLVFKVSLQHGRRRPASWSWRGSKSTQTRPSASTLVKLRGPGGGNGVWTLLEGRSWEWRGGGSGSGTNVFAFDTGSDMGLHFELADKRGFTCFGSAHCSASHQLPFRQFVESSPSNGCSISRTLVLYPDDDDQSDSSGTAPRVSFDLNVETPSRGPCSLKLNAGRFESIETCDDVWGPISFPRIPVGVPNNSCIVATHGIIWFYRVQQAYISPVSNISPVLEDCPSYATVSHLTFRSDNISPVACQLFKQIRVTSIGTLSINSSFSKRHNRRRFATCFFHSLFDHNERLQFTCRIVHSLPLMMSAVQIYFGGQLSAMSHLVGKDQLPSVEQVNRHSSAAHLDAAAGERAMIVKDSEGDWGIVIGQWVANGNGKESSSSRTGKPSADQLLVNGNQPCPINGSGGYFQFRFVSLRTPLPPVNVVQQQRSSMQHDVSGVASRTLPDLQTGRFDFRLDALAVDMRTGSVTVSADTEDIPQNVCLAFSIAVLFVMCQPRSRPPMLQPPASFSSEAASKRDITSSFAETNYIGDETSTDTVFGPQAADRCLERFETGNKSASKRTKQRKNNDSIDVDDDGGKGDLELVVAAGFLYETPFNSYIKCGVCGGVCGDFGGVDSGGGAVHWADDDAAADADFMGAECEFGDAGGDFLDTGFNGDFAAAACGACGGCGGGGCGGGCGGCGG